jgi:putative endopeptidase
MIHKTAALLGASLLALATPAFADDHTHDEATDTLQSTETGSALPTISFGSWGFDPAYLAADIKPGDDFNAYANKKWIDANPLPPEFSRIGAFTLLGEKSTADVKALIDEFAAKDPATLTSDQKRILDTYRGFLDTDAIEARGLAPAQPYLQRIFGANSLDKLAMLWAEPGFSACLTATTISTPRIRAARSRTSTRPISPSCWARRAIATLRRLPKRSMPLKTASRAGLPGTARCAATAISPTTS